MSTTAIDTVPEQQTAIAVIDRGTPLPVFSGEEMAGAFQAYRQLQQTLDKAMPDQIMTISGRMFRKKGYWRSIRTAFNLTVECVSEQRDQVDDDWGYLVTYRATAPNGRFADGDGACYASEKTGRGQATVHNVRSHAHTRAFNRAVSNLVGFGEVSAEEADRQSGGQQQRSTSSAGAGSDALISEPQWKRMWAIAKNKGWSDDEVKALLTDQYNVTSSKHVQRRHYDAICASLEAGHVIDTTATEDERAPF